MKSREQNTTTRHQRCRAQDSMTEDYKPTDNGIAERVNGIIKTEKLYRQPLYKSIDDARGGYRQVYYVLQRATSAHE